MSMEKCPHCGNEYDTEVYEKCPLCKEEAETEEISVCEADTEENYESSRKTKRILNGIIVILIVLIIAALGRLVYLCLPYNAPNTINVKNFSVSDVEGTYTDRLSGQYFTFEAKSTDVKIASDAILSDGAKGETITFDGTFVTGYMSDEIQNIAMKNFVIGKNLGEEYVGYKIKRGAKGEVYADYIKDFGHTEDYSAFEAEHNVAKTAEAYKMNGYWTLDDGELILYGEDGTLVVPCEITKNGIIFSNLHFEGKVKRGILSENFLSFTSEDGAVTQTITTYKDGNLILTTEREGADVQKDVGIYCITDGYMTISLSGSVDSFSLTDYGMTQLLFNKE